MAPVADAPEEPGGAGGEPGLKLRFRKGSWVLETEERSLDDVLQLIRDALEFRPLGHVRRHIPDGIRGERGRNVEAQEHRLGRG